MVIDVRRATLFVLNIQNLKKATFMATKSN